jgi:hypothetical protein
MLGLTSSRVARQARRKDVYSPLNLDTTNLRNSTAQGGR